ncbi:hypothetical protein JVU11DRAFT_8777 [Chiua virens]|nr:hypothetical protein JVU11DRAFT_8777 [Chiua virens]
MPTHMKKQHAAVVALKNASGFTYSDKDGAVIALEQKDVWSRYVKSHINTKPFKNKGFVHFNSMEHFASSTSKGKFLFQPPGASSTSHSTAINVHELSAATHRLSVSNAP